MKKIVLYFCIIPLLFLNISGCAPLIIGGAVGALGAYAVSKDTIEGDTDKPYESLWSSAVMLARARGTIKAEDRLKGTIELEADSSRVYITMVRLTRSTVRMRVSVRKHHLPNLTLAQDLFVRIIDGA
jgi:hypothetical protein